MLRFCVSLCLLSFTTVASAQSGKALSQPDPKGTFTAEGIGNAASYVSGGVSPGEIVTIFGTQLGPPEFSGLVVNAGVVANTLAGVQVLFDGVPAPLIYVLDTKVSAVVPYAVYGRNSTMVEIQNQGLRFGPVEVPVVDAVPGLFTLDASGSGQVAALNDDFSVNFPTNPAGPGAWVALFATGEGQTDPSGIDGLIATAKVLSKPLLDVGVMIGGEPAQVLYAGAAPDLVAGVMQINVIPSPSVVPGPAVPVRITVGGKTSIEGPTLAMLSNLGTPAPGEMIALHGIRGEDSPTLSAGAQVENDLLLEFQILDQASAPLIKATLQDRVTRSFRTRSLNFAPRIRDNMNLGAGAVLFRMDVTGFAGVLVQVEYQTDGLGDLGPSSVSRSADGDTLTFVYDPPLAAPSESYFPSIITNAANSGPVGSITLHARAQGGSVFTTTLEGTQAPLP